jgi:hypothetical protein
LVQGLWRGCHRLAVMRHDVAVSVCDTWPSDTSNYRLSAAPLEAAHCKQDTTSCDRSATLV